MSIQVIVGLGNPGTDYHGTRHNIGFTVVDALASTHSILWNQHKRFLGMFASISFRGKPLYLLKPLTYMNESGRSVEKLCQFYRIKASAVIVIYDDITLDVGNVKLSTRGSSGGHNGIENLLTHIGSDFVRYRVGVGGKTHPEMDLKDHVLSRFFQSEQELIKSRLPTYVSDLERVMTLGVDNAMNHINQRSRNYEPDSNT